MLPTHHLPRTVHRRHLHRNMALLLDTGITGLLQFNVDRQGNWDHRINWDHRVAKGANSDLRWDLMVDSIVILDPQSLMGHTVCKINGDHLA